MAGKDLRGIVPCGENDVIVGNPDPALVALLEKGADGGYGEFEEFLPDECQRLAEEHDAGFEPELHKLLNGHTVVGHAVVWVRVQ